jgi:hypothetical protein
LPPVRDLRVRLGENEATHLLQGLLNLGEIAGGGVERRIGGDFTFNQHARAQELKRAGAGVQYKRHRVDRLADVSARTAANLQLTGDLQRDHSFADGRTAYAADLSQVNLSGQTCAGFQPLLRDVTRDAGRNFLVAAVGFYHSVMSLGQTQLMASTNLRSTTLLRSGEQENLLSQSVTLPSMDMTVDAEK